MIEGPRPDSRRPREPRHDAPQPPLRVRIHPLYPRVVAGAAGPRREAARGARDLVGQAAARARRGAHHGSEPGAAVAVRLRLGLVIAFHQAVIPSACERLAVRCIRHLLAPNAGGNLPGAETQPTRSCGIASPWMKYRAVWRRSARNPSVASFAASATGS